MTQSALSASKVANDASNELNFEVRWAPVPTRLVFNEVMMAIIGCFTELALRHPVELVEVPVFEGQFPPYRPIFRLRSTNAQIRPLWFKYGTVNTVLLKLTDWYMMYMECKATALTIHFDDTFAGFGGIAYSDQRLMIPSSNRTANVSISPQ